MFVWLGGPERTETCTFNLFDELDQAFRSSGSGCFSGVVIEEYSYFRSS